MPSIHRIAPLLGMIALAAPASAAPEGPPNTAATSIDEAKIHYKAGESYYQHADYVAAKREFGESFRLSNRGALLYNIGLCEEKLGDFKGAAASLRAYLLLPESQRDRANVSAKLTTLDRLARERVAVATPGKPPGKPIDVLVTAPEPPSPPPERGYRKYGWPVLGVGALSLLGSLVTGLIAHNHFTDLTMRCGAAGNACPAGFTDERDTGQSLAFASDGLLLAGVVVVAVAVILLLVKRPVREGAMALLPSLSPSLSLSPGRAGLAAAVTF